MIISDIQELRTLVPGLDGSLDFGTIQPMILSAENEVANSITKEVYDEATQDERCITFIKRAVAAFAMYNNLIFWSVSRNNTDQGLYKYQYEEIKERYISMYWESMNNILSFLDDNADLGGWSETNLYKERKELIITSAREFSYYFNIDNSEYFFIKTLFLQRKVINDNIASRIRDLDSIEDKKLLGTVKRALCYEVMAEAIIKFDLTELPKSIRNDLAHEFSKNGSQMQAREKLYANLMSDVRAWHKSIENAVKAGSQAAIANPNIESDKFYMI